MLEEPDLQHERIIACLQNDYGVHVVQLDFLPLGADLNTAVYRVVADDGMTYFLKLRSGIFDETSVALPKFLSNQRLAQSLQAQPSQPTLCHSDIHAGNLLIDADAALYIVDWDNPNLAPKERDLIGIGGGLMGNWRPPEQEELLFFQGYGEVQIDPRALAYYRYERIIQDIAVFGEQLFLTPEGGEDRVQALRFLMSNFLPNHTIQIAYKSDSTLMH